MPNSEQVLPAFYSSVGCSASISSTGADAVSYTHLDVYKRQAQAALLAAPGYDGLDASAVRQHQRTHALWDVNLVRAEGIGCLLYTSRGV